MDAKGHKTISEVGERLLKTALERNNPSRRMRLGAFYMGNWLTDISQVVDPAAYENVKDTLLGYSNAIEKLFERMIADAPSWMQAALDTKWGKTELANLRANLHEAQKTLNDNINFIFGEGRSGKLQDTFREVFKGIGYYKFVLNDQGVPDAMHEKSFFAVYDKRFTQYYPHEHMDRPKEGGVYSLAKSTGPLNTRTKIINSKGDLYTYVRKDIKAAAGHLAYIDGGKMNPCTHPGWAVGTFNPDLSKFAGADGELHDVSDDDIEWNQHLALLGHALHNIEDYFAHSTFIDHAAGGLPGKYKFLSRLEDTDKLARRLKEWKPGIDEKNWGELDDDTHVVTGFFEFNDTLISLAHLIDKKLSRPDTGIGHDVDEAIGNVWEFAYRKFLTDTLEFVSDPIAVWDTNDPADDDYDEKSANMAVKWLHEQGGRDLRLLRENDPTLNRLIAILLKHPLLSNRPQPVKEAFSKSVKSLGAIVGGVGMAITLYGMLKNIRDFFTNPLKFLRSFVGDLIYDNLLRYGEVYIKNLLYVYMGALKIGSHSLIAKDSEQAVLFDAAMNCAEAVHWYVVTQLTRHSVRQPIAICRSGEGLDNRSAILQYQWIDWHELVEYFLSYPFAYVETEQETIQLASNRKHITRMDRDSVMSPDSLASLADEYRGTHIHIEGGPRELTWEVIADANFPTTGLSTQERIKRINAVLKNQPEDAVVTNGGINYAYRGGVEVVIPYQRVNVMSRRARDVQLLWWRSVILDGWENSKNKLGHEALSIPLKDQQKFIQDADDLRSQLEGAYK